MAILISPLSVTQLFFQQKCRILSFVKNDDIYNQALQHWIEFNKKKFPQVECLKVDFDEITEFYSENRDDFDLNDILIIGRGKVLNVILRPNFQSLIILFSQVINENSTQNSKKIYKIIPLHCRKYHFLIKKNKQSTQITNTYGQNQKTEISKKSVCNKAYLKATKDKSKKVSDIKISYSSSENKYNIDFVKLREKYERYKVVRLKNDKDLSNKSL